MLARTLSVIGLLGLLSIPALASAKCELQPYAALPVTMRNMQPIVKGTINGKSAVFLMDSGAFYSTLSKDSVDKFGITLLNSQPSTLLRGPQSSMLLEGVNGLVRTRVGSAKDFTLNGLADGQVLHDVSFLVGGEIFGNGLDGLIGQNILGHADTEYDLDDGLVRLFITRGCHRANLAYWAGSTPVTMMRLHRFSDYENGVLADASLNGEKIEVLFDTGSTNSTLSLKAAKRVGISLHSKDVEQGGLGQGFAKGRTENWIAHFDSLNLNGEIIKNARLAISRMSNSDFDLLLGADFFLSHRIFIAKSQRRIYFTYNGGPVFDYADSGAGSKQAKTEAGSDQAGEKEDAASIKRRAMALVSRHEYGAALSAFDDVIQLAPQDADNYLQRGLVYMDVEKPKLALKDLSQALKIRPDMEKALLARGSVYLWQNDDAAAKADFDAAIRLAKPDSTVQLEIGSRYLYRHEFNEAVTHFTAWIDANPGGQQLPFALTHRCEARAYANQELKSALEDCRLALRKVRGDSDMLANMALVYLRLGDYDKAIYYYKKSIKLQPKSDWSLYGLGIAEQRKGASANGAESIKAALAIDPDVAHAYKSIGLEPAGKSTASDKGG